MVSTEYTGTISRPSASRLAALHGRADGISEAIRSAGRIDPTLPEDMARLLDALDLVPDRIIGRG
jgi:hypothetical protein